MSNPDVIGVILRKNITCITLTYMEDPKDFCTDHAVIMMSTQITLNVIMVLVLVCTITIYFAII